MDINDATACSGVAGYPQLDGMLPSSLWNRQSTIQIRLPPLHKHNKTLTKRLHKIHLFLLHVDPLSGMMVIGGLPGRRDLFQGHTCPARQPQHVLWTIVT